MNNNDFLQVSISLNSTYPICMDDPIHQMLTHQNFTLLISRNFLITILYHMITEALGLVTNVQVFKYLWIWKF